MRWVESRHQMAVDIRHGHGNRRVDGDVCYQTSADISCRSLALNGERVLLLDCFSEYCSKQIIRS